MVTIKLRIGKSMLEMQANSVKEVHKFCAVYGALPRVCDNCQSDDIYLNYKSPKGNDYYTLTCKKCNAELTFHQKKEGGSYVVFGEKMTVYQSSNNQDFNQGSNNQETPKDFNEAVTEQNKQDGIPY